MCPIIELLCDRVYVCVSVCVQVYLYAGISTVAGCGRPVECATHIVKLHVPTERMSHALIELDPLG